MAIKKSKGAKRGPIERKKPAKRRLAALASLKGFVVASPLKDELVLVRKMLELGDPQRQAAMTRWSAPSRSKAELYSRRQVATLLSGRR